MVRYHTWPMLRRETVAEHTWHVLVLWDRLFGMPQPLVVRQVLYHDVGEMYTGDIPFPVKRDHPALGEMVSDLEVDARNLMGVPMPPLAPPDKWRLRVCDLIDMLEVGYRERMMGNKFATPIIDGTHAEVMRMCHVGCEGVPAQEVQHVADHITTMWLAGPRIKDME